MQHFEQLKAIIESQTKSSVTNDQVVKGYCHYEANMIVGGCGVSYIASMIEQGVTPTTPTSINSTLEEDDEDGGEIIEEAAKFISRWLTK